MAGFLIIGNLSTTNLKEHCLNYVRHVKTTELVKKDKAIKCLLDNW